MKRDDYAAGAFKRVALAAERAAEATQRAVEATQRAADKRKRDDGYGLIELCVAALVIIVLLLLVWHLAATR